ncbi:hypothetical protein HK104_005924 [Borealophlyctis nickersoniae]|nr:hypothetical protein HK104_005924 [Borealophlyctis nickersoniae]
MPEDRRDRPYQDESDTLRYQRERREKVSKRTNPDEEEREEALGSDPKRTCVGDPREGTVLAEAEDQGHPVGTTAGAVLSLREGRAELQAALPQLVDAPRMGERIPVALDKGKAPVMAAGDLELCRKLAETLQEYRGKKPRVLQLSTRPSLIKTCAYRDGLFTATENEEVRSALIYLQETEGALRVYTGTSLTQQGCLHGAIAACDWTTLSTDSALVLPATVVGAPEAGEPVLMLTTLKEKAVTDLERVRNKAKAANGGLIGWGLGAAHAAVVGGCTEYVDENCVMRWKGTGEASHPLHEVVQYLNTSSLGLAIAAWSEVLSSETAKAERLLASHVPQLFQGRVPTACGKLGIELWYRVDVLPCHYTNLTWGWRYIVALSPITLALPAVDAKVEMRRGQMTGFRAEVLHHATVDSSLWSEEALCVVLYTSITAMRAMQDDILEFMTEIWGPGWTSAVEANDPDIV